MALDISIWQLLAPNLYNLAGGINLATIIGALLIAIGVLALVYVPVGKKFSVGFVLLGIILVWGVSIVQDLWQSPQGQAIVIGVAGGLAIIMVLIAGREDSSNG